MLHRVWWWIGLTTFAICIVVISIAASQGQKSTMRREWILPLRMVEGVLSAELVVSGQRTRAIVDTGSDHLLIASHACEPCPNRVRFDLSNASSTREVVFGSQSDTVRFLTTRVRIGSRTIRTRVGAVVKRSGQSSFNVMGLAPGTFLDSLGTSRVLIYVHRTRGFVAFGDVRKRRKFVYLPLLKSPTLNYYMIRIEGIAIDGEVVRTQAQVAVVDTGSNMTACGQSVFRDIFEPAMRENRDISLLLRTSSGSRARFTITSKTYRWRGSGETLIEPYEDFEQDETVIVLGALFFQGFALDFDYARGRLGFRKI